MQSIKILISLLALIVFIFTFLFCEESPVESQEYPNLLANGSFEKNNNPTLQGWTFGNRQLARLTNEAPPKGGNWSLELTADWAPTSGYAETFVVTELSPGDILKLSAFVKALGPAGGGFIQLKIGSLTPRMARTSETSWNEVSVTDTVKTGTVDTVWVRLSSLHTERMARKGLFDLVRLERIKS